MTAGRLRANGLPSAIALGLAAGWVGGPLAAQQPEPLWERLRSTFQQEALTVGALLQIVGDAQIERSAPGPNGFSVANARFRLEGRLDGGFEYFFQTAFTQSPAVLDARVGYRAAEALTLDAGLFKAPVSREFLTGAGSIDFVNRSRVVAGLAPGRQIGVQARGFARAGRLEYRAGVFNGNGIQPGGNDDGRLMYAARLGWWPWGGPGNSAPTRRAEVGLSVARSDDDAAPVPLFGAAFAGRRLVLGADTRWRSGPTLVAAELVLARLNPAGPAGTVAPQGWHATLGRHVTPRSQLLVRWDALRGDGVVPDGDQLVLGWNRWPTQATELQVNWLVDLADAAPRRHQILINLQVAF